MTFAAALGLAALALMLARLWKRPAAVDGAGLDGLAVAGATVALVCLWCRREAFTVHQTELVTPDREPKPCGSCGRPVYFVSQDHGGRWCIS